VVVDVRRPAVLHHWRPGSSRPNSSPFPVSGFDTGLAGVKFILLPVLIGFISGVGGSVRYNRHHLPRRNQQGLCAHGPRQGAGRRLGPVQARAQERHDSDPDLRVVSIPFLIMGNLLLENFLHSGPWATTCFDAIQKQDFAVVRRQWCTSVGCCIIVGLIFVDISYTTCGPRVRWDDENGNHRSSKPL